MPHGFTAYGVCNRVGFPVSGFSMAPAANEIVVALVRHVGNHFGHPSQSRTASANSSPSWTSE